MNDSDSVNVKFSFQGGNTSAYLTVQPGHTFLSTPSTGDGRIGRLKIPGATLEPVLGDGTVSDSDTLQDIDNALINLNEMLSLVASKQTFFSERAKSLEVEKDALIKSGSQYKDTDFAKESAHMTREQIRQQGAASMLTQANSQAQFVLNLLP